MKTSMTRKVAYLIVILGAAALVRAAKAGAESPANQPAAVEQAIRTMFGLHAIMEAVISPDGRRVAWAESLAGKNGAPSLNAAIYVADWKSPAGRVRVSAANGAAANEGRVAWSPDSKQIAFLSDAAHAGQQELYVATPGSAARQLTHVKGDLADAKWSPDGKTIAVLFIENAPRASGPLAAETRDEGVVGAKIYEQRLALVDATTGRMREISPADLYVYEYDWAPDGKRIVATAAPGNGDDNWYVAKIHVFDAATGGDQSIYTPPVTLQMGAPKWSPDGKTIAFIGGIMSDEGSVGGDIYTLSAEGGEPKDVTPGMKASAATLDWAADSKTIRFGEIVDGQSGIAEVNVDSGAISTTWTGAERMGASRFGVGASFSRDGEMSATVRQSFGKPPEVWAGPTGAWKQVTHINQGLKPEWGEAKSLHWKTDVGEAQGWVVYPKDFDATKRYPLVVCVHGGPAAANMPSWPSRWSYQMTLPSAGYFLLFPNPRGSYGMGEAFTRANVKDFGGGDFRDIMAGVDEAIKTLPIDPEKLGITGWSYGGYMSMWAVTQTNRFKAAVIGAGLSDWVSYYGENQIDKWMIPYFGASVYEDPAVYAKSAPIDFVKNVKTPSLIVVGDSDGECPPPQSYEFWHALVYFGVPTQFVIYPHEGHGFVDPAHSRDVAERAVAWFNSRM
ncbi:MAG TPA: S9 family peptidase [Candidatus Acidoferrales bacterium]|nr:S9 family peptidase [Candidatus Acidoferrales bacterium]